MLTDKNVDDVVKLVRLTRAQAPNFPPPARAGGFGRTTAVLRRSGILVATKLMSFSEVRVGSVSSGDIKIPVA